MVEFNATVARRPHRGARESSDSSCYSGQCLLTAGAVRRAACVAELFVRGGGRDVLLACCVCS